MAAIWWTSKNSRSFFSKINADIIQFTHNARYIEINHLVQKFESYKITGMCEFWTQNTSREHYNIYFLKFFIHKLDASLQITVHGQNYTYNEKNKIKQKLKSMLTVLNSITHPITTTGQ